MSDAKLTNEEIVDLEDKIFDAKRVKLFMVSSQMSSGLPRQAPESLFLSASRRWAFISSAPLEGSAVTPPQ